ncbi:MAG: riboflavin biosynthesis protein RibF [Fournierella sp.]|uniref:riboflavin biosynthesis protein RibF n=1 Tax=Allofournierella sp. TaxID=1940256 RepID=UPI002A83B632|nr:riboflavin biosynthesis protein RibF [Fournierella sp.]MDY4166357.1 riboflavin biosynthesis protein RibF [Fournierella sp.]
MEADLTVSRGCSVALGFFDGVHLGHQAVIRAAALDAAENGRSAAVFTFQLPLSSTMKGGRLQSETEKHQVMEGLGVEYYMEPPFEAFCGQSPEEFVERILHRGFKARAVFCGDNFTFGKKAAGNVETLRQLCEPLGIRVQVVPMATYQGQLVSSTRIRAALAEGDIPAVNAMLGRPYRIDFAVRHGKGLGRTLGFPTINQIYPEGFAAPKYGIYITRVKVNGQWYAGATGFGTRPTVNTTGEGATCETFIPDFSGQLYGEEPELEFYEYIAPSRKFDTLEELTACVNGAAAKAKEYFARHPMDE